MSHCAECACWITDKQLLFANFERLEPLAGPGKGICRGPLGGLAVGPEFGCVAFIPGDQHIDIQDHRPLEVWEVWEMIPCPDCLGKGTPGEVPDHPANSTMGFSADNRCAGTGNVRRYGDGHVGDEQTRMHPLEAAKIRAEKEALLRGDLDRQIAELDKPPAATDDPIKGSSNLPF